MISLTITVDKYIYLLYTLNTNHINAILLMKNEHKEAFRGKEHLLRQLEKNQSNENKSVSADNQERLIMRKEFAWIIVLIFILFGTLGLITYFNNTDNILESLANIITEYI